jgi:hypothetical protein
MLLALVLDVASPLPSRCVSWAIDGTGKMIRGVFRTL